MDSIGFGVDLSHHNTNPPWARIKASCDFVICRASYGGALRDRKVIEHVSKARDLGIKTGLYQFYRPSQPVNDHFKMLKLVADVVQMGDGDIIPAIDVELDPIPDPGTPVSAAWEPDLKELVDRVKKEWGACMIYITQADFRLLGSPLWLLENPLWIAHFTPNPTPASPAGRKPVIWQYRCGPFDPTAPGGAPKPWDLDHNRLVQPLPLIGAQHEADPIDEDLRAMVLGQVAMTSAEIVYHRESYEGEARSARRCA